jgi:hypothetical protein
MAISKATYRLQLARGYLEKAENNGRAGQVG